MIVARWAVLGLAAAVLAACSSGEPAPPPAPAPVTPPPASMPAPLPPIAVRPTPPDQCGASQMQDLVGKLRSDIPIPTDPRQRRVACTTCPVTQDYREDRLNIFFDAQTGVIKEVKCG